MSRTDSPTEPLNGKPGPLRSTPAARLFFGLLGLVLFLASVVVHLNLAGILIGLTYLILIGCTWFDLTEFRVPNVLTYPGTIGVLVITAVIPEAQWMAAIAGAVVGSVAFIVLGVVSRGTVGLGDAKLVAFGGAVVGIESLLAALLAGSISALVPVLGLLLLGRINRKQPLPYAPFLALGFGLVLAVNGSTFST